MPSITQPQINALKAATTRLCEKVDRFAHMLGKAEAERDRLKIELQAAKDAEEDGAIQAMLNFMWERNDIKADKAELVNELAALAKERDALKAEVEALEGERDELKRNWASAQTDVHGLIEELMADVNHFSDGFVQTIKERDALQAERDRYKAERDSSETKADTLENLFSERQAHHAKVERLRGLVRDASEEAWNTAYDATVENNPFAKYIGTKIVWADWWPESLAAKDLAKVVGDATD